LDTAGPARRAVLPGRHDSVAVIYWILMPAFPTGRSYTKGLLGIDQRAVVMQQVREATSGTRCLDGSDRDGEP